MKEVNTIRVRDRGQEKKENKLFGRCRSPCGHRAGKFCLLYQETKAGLPMGNSLST